MKAKILCDYIFPYYASREKLKKGDVVDVNMEIRADSGEVLNAPNGLCYLCKHNGWYGYIPVVFLDIDFSEKDIDWEQRRYELTKDAMQGLISGLYYLQRETTTDGWTNREFCSSIEIAKCAIDIADETIRQLKIK